MKQFQWTYKSWKQRHEEEYETVKYECTATYPTWGYKVGDTYIKTFSLKRAGIHPKKKKNVDTEYHWMTTPSWWNRMQHTRPERRRVKIALSQVSDVEEADIPDLGRKPHMYFW